MAAFNYIVQDGSTFYTMQKLERKNFIKLVLRYPPYGYIISP
jgi:hypothetical protein